MFGNASLSVETLHHNRDVLMAALQTLGITNVTIDYEGYGDSGDVSGVSLQPETLQPLLQTEKVALRRVTHHHANDEWQYTVEEGEARPLEEALTDFTFAWLELHHGGWENNEGARGTVTINVAENRFDLEHESFYTESSHHAYEL